MTSKEETDTLECLKLSFLFNYVLKLRTGAKFDLLENFQDQVSTCIFRMQRKIQRSSLPVEHSIRKCPGRESWGLMALTWCENMGYFTGLNLNFSGQNGKYTFCWDFQGPMSWRIWTYTTIFDNLNRSYPSWQNFVLQENHPRSCYLGHAFQV